MALSTQPHELVQPTYSQTLEMTTSPIRRQYELMMSRNPDYRDQCKLINIFENRGFTSKNMSDAGLISMTEQEVVVRVQSPFHEYIEAKIALQAELPIQILIEQTWYEIALTIPSIDEKGVKYQIKMIGQVAPNYNENRLKNNPIFVTSLTTDSQLTRSEIIVGVLSFEKVDDTTNNELPVTHVLKVTKDGHYHRFIEQLRLYNITYETNTKWTIPKGKRNYLVLETTTDANVVTYWLQEVTKS